MKSRSSFLLKTPILEYPLHCTKTSQLKIYTDLNNKIFLEPLQIRHNYTLLQKELEGGTTAVNYRFSRTRKNQILQNLKFNSS